MTLRTVEARSILRRFRRIDSWFVARSGMNLYRGCAHDCAYCDGRAEKYRVDGDFGSDVQVKANALEVLRRELSRDADPQPELWRTDRPRVRPGLASGFVMLGGGVGDTYQPAERETLMARQVLGLLEELGLPIHILTKSELVLRDADVIRRLGRGPGALVSFSISTADDSIAAGLEPGASPPSRRLAALAELRRRGISGGVYLLPVLPFLSDSPEMIDRSVKAALDAGAQYVLFGGMTLKPGRQRDHFLRVLSAPICGRVAALYPESGTPARWGTAAPGYYEQIDKVFAEVSIRRRAPPRIPRALFPKTLQGIDLVVVLFDQMNALLRLQGRSSCFGREAARIARLSSTRDPGLFEGPAAAQAREILSRGTCGLYDRLMAERSPPAVSPT